MHNFYAYRDSKSSNYSLSGDRRDQQSSNVPPSMSYVDQYQNQQYLQHNQMQQQQQQMMFGPNPMQMQQIKNGSVNNEWRRAQPRDNDEHNRNNEFDNNENNGNSFNNKSQNQNSKKNIKDLNRKLKHIEKVHEKQITKVTRDKERAENKAKEASNLVELVNNVASSIEIIVIENNKTLYEKSEDEIKKIKQNIEKTRKRKVAKSLIRNVLQNKGIYKMPLWRHKNNGNYQPPPEMIMPIRRVFRVVLLVLMKLCFKPWVAIQKRRRETKEKERKALNRTLQMHTEPVNDWLGNILKIPLSSLMRDNEMDFSSSTKHRIMQLKVRVNSMIDQLTDSPCPESFLLDFLSIIMMDGNYFPKDFLDYETEYLLYDQFGAVRSMQEPTDGKHFNPEEEKQRAIRKREEMEEQRSVDDFLNPNNNGNSSNNNAVPLLNLDALNSKSGETDDTNGGQYWFNKEPTDLTMDLEDPQCKMGTRLVKVRRVRLLLIRYVLLNRLIYNCITAPWSIGLCGQPSLTSNADIAKKRIYNLRMLATIFYELCRKVEPAIPAIQEQPTEITGDNSNSGNDSEINDEMNGENTANNISNDSKDRNSSTNADDNAAKVEKEAISGVSDRESNNNNGNNDGDGNGNSEEKKDEDEKKEVEAKDDSNIPDLEAGQADININNVSTSTSNNIRENGKDATGIPSENKDKGDLNKNSFFSKMSVLVSNLADELLGVNLKTDFLGEEERLMLERIIATRGHFISIWKLQALLLPPSQTKFFRTTIDEIVEAHTPALCKWIGKLMLAVINKDVHPEIITARTGRMPTARSLHLTHRSQVHQGAEVGPGNVTGRSHTGRKTEHDKLQESVRSARRINRAAGTPPSSAGSIRSLMNGDTGLELRHVKTQGQRRRRSSLGNKSNDIDMDASLGTIVEEV